MHASRPLVCRTYPLGGTDSEPVSYWEAELSPGSDGVFSEEGTVADFLRSQGVDEPRRARKLYLKLYEEASQHPGCDDGLDVELFLDVDLSAEQAGEPTIGHPFEAIRAHLDRLRRALGLSG